MKRVVVLLSIVAVMVLCVSLHAATIYKITFDKGVMANGPADYTAGANEILPTDVHGDSGQLLSSAPDQDK